MRTILLAGVAALTVLAAAPAMAGYTDPASWTAGGSGSQSVTAVTGGIRFDYSFDPGYCGGCYYPSWSFQTVASNSGLFSFDYEQNGNYAYYHTAGALYLNNYTTGASILLNNNNSVFSVSGTGSIAVTAGDLIGFNAYASNDDYQSYVGGNITLTNIAPDEVPEPAMLGLFGLSAVGLGLARRRRG